MKRSIKLFILVFVLAFASAIMASGVANFDRITIWGTGQSLTASALNAEYNQIYNNFDTDGMDDYSASTAEMRGTADPYPAASPSLATSLTGELQRIRYMLAQISGETYWYIDTDTDLASIEDTYINNGTSGDTAYGPITFDAYIKTDIINEVTATSGVLIDGVTLKDKLVYADQVNEKTSENGVLIEGVFFKDNIAYTDQINEKTSAAGVTIDGFLIKDGGPDASVWPSFSVNRNTSQQDNITGTDKVEWTTELFDTNNNFIANRFTPTVAGKYFLTASVFWSNLIAGDIINILIYKNGALVKQNNTKSSHTDESIPVSGIFDANGSTDYFEVFAANAGRDTSDLSGSVSLTYFDGSMIAQ